MNNSDKDTGSESDSDPKSISIVSTAAIAAIISKNMNSKSIIILYHLKYLWHYTKDSNVCIA